METVGMTEQDLFQYAVENTKRLLPAKITPMTEVIKGMFSSEWTEMGILQTVYQTMYITMIRI